MKHLVILRPKRFRVQRVCCVSSSSSSSVVEREARNARMPSSFIRSVPLQSKLFRAVVAFLQRKAMAGLSSSGKREAEGRG